MAKEETKSGAAPTAKKKDKKNVPVGVAHVNATFNNTIITITDPFGNTVAWSSSGANGFKGSRKSTPYAAQVAAEVAGRKAQEHGMRTVEVLVKGPGATGWFGWYGSPVMQERIQAWFDAPDAARQKALADEINKLAQDDVATIPLGQFRIRSAWRRSITGLAQGSMPYPWGVRPVG